MNDKFSKVICVANISGFSYYDDLKIGNIYYCRYTYNISHVYMIYDINHNFICFINSFNINKLFKYLENFREERLNGLL